MTNEQLKVWGCVNSRMGPVPCQIFGVSCVSHVREPREWRSNSTGYDMHGCVILRQNDLDQTGHDALPGSIWGQAMGLHLVHAGLNLSWLLFQGGFTSKNYKIYTFNPVIIRCFSHWTHRDTQLKMSDVCNLKIALVCLLPVRLWWQYVKKTHFQLIKKIQAFRRAVCRRTTLNLQG